MYLGHLYWADINTLYAATLQTQQKKKLNSFNSILLCPSIYCRLAQWFKDCTSILCSKDSMHAYTLLFISICSTVFECSRTNKLIWHTEVFKKTQANTPKNKKESVWQRHFKLRDLHVVFRPAFKGCNCALTLSLDQWLSNFLPCCALSCLEGWNGHLSFIARSVGVFCNGPHPCHL